MFERVKKSYIKNWFDWEQNVGNLFGQFHLTPFLPENIFIAKTK